MVALNVLLAQSKKPKAVMCSNDLTAVGVICESYVKQIRVPQRPIGGWF